jgi:hypothetical protein
VSGNPRYDVDRRHVIIATHPRTGGLPSTPLATTAADVLARDRQRGEPPLAVHISRDAELLAG